MTTTTTTRTNATGQPIGPDVPGWTPRPLPPRTPMVGRTCSIVPFDPAAHGDDLTRAYLADADGGRWTYLFYDRPADAKAMRAYFDMLAPSEDPLFHTIIDASSGKAVGMASLMRIDPKMGVIEVGNINYASAMAGTTIATECMFLFMRRVFDELGYRRYEWKCDSYNAPSRAAALRYGFRYEGLFRQAVIYKGRSRDTTWYAMVDKDWPALKAAYEAWLSPANFDAAGRQNVRLSELMPEA